MTEIEIKKLAKEFAESYVLASGMDVSSTTKRFLSDELEAFLRIIDRTHIIISRENVMKEIEKWKYPKHQKEPDTISTYFKGYGDGILNFAKEQLGVGAGRRCND